ncbi:torsin-4A [Zonotrichia albicollis]|uniref:torsin-4A n=1 Tax=Zonotrichia albicollis TaxID=44394 RepID=UPI003D80B2A9
MEEELPCSEVDEKSVLRNLGVEMPCMESNPTGDTSGAEEDAGEVPCAESSTKEESATDPGIVFTEGSVEGDTQGSGSDGVGDIAGSGSDREGDIPGNDREGDIAGSASDREGEIPGSASASDEEIPGSGSNREEKIPGSGSDREGDIAGSGREGEIAGSGSDREGDIAGSGREGDIAGSGSNREEKIPGSGSDGVGDIPGSGSDREGDIAGSGSASDEEIPGSGSNREGDIAVTDSDGEGDIAVTDSDREGEMPCDAKEEASCSESDAEEVPDAVIPAAPKKITSISSPLRAFVRLRRRYQGLKKSRLHLELPREKSAEFVHTSLLQRQLSLSRTSLYNPSMAFFNQSGFESSQYFTFDTSVEHYSVKKCRRKKSRRKSRMVLYPDKTKKYLPAEEKSKAKRCLLLLIAIMFFQILNAIENLDDNLQKYDLDGLEKTMHREVFGQKVAVESIVELLKDYLATHVHNKPLVISLNGPTGVGKSHVGWVLAKHFRSVMDNDFVLQYFVMHHCPSGVAPLTCAIDLSKKIADMVTRAEIEEKTPLFILDEVELMSPVLLDTLSRFFEPNQTNEFLNAIYILISNLGGDEITKFITQNASTELLHQQRGAEELLSIIQPVLARVHPLWKAADIIPFILLEKAHVINCFLEQMRREGLYPDQKHIENLANQLSYYTTGDKQYSSMGCKQVVAKVNLL